VFPQSTFAQSPILQNLTDFSNILSTHSSSTFCGIAHDSNIRAEMTWGETATTQAEGKKTR
jgi:hypothetical protein